MMHLGHAARRVEDSSGHATFDISCVGLLRRLTRTALVDTFHLLDDSPRAHAQSIILKNLARVPPNAIGNRQDNIQGVSHRYYVVFQCSAVFSSVSA